MTISQISNTPIFPAEVKAFIKAKDSIGLQSFFKEHPAVQKAFNEWAAAHGDFMAKSPTMKQFIATIELGSATESLAKRVTESTRGFHDKVEEELANPNYYKLSPVSFFSNLPEITEYFEIGLISAEQCIESLSTPGKKNKLTLLQTPDNFEKFIPFLEKLSMDEERLVTLLSIGGEDKTPLHDRLVFQKAIPFLEKLPLPLLMRLLSIKDKKGSNPLQSPSVFEWTTSFLQKKLPPESLKVHLNNFLIFFLLELNKVKFFPISPML